VIVDGLGGDEQLRGDLGVGATSADQVEHVTFAPGQAARMFAGCCVTPGGDGPESAGTHPPPSRSHCRHGSEVSQETDRPPLRRLVVGRQQAQSSVVASAQVRDGATFDLGPQTNADSPAVRTALWASAAPYRVRPATTRPARRVWVGCYPADPRSPPELHVALGCRRYWNDATRTWSR